VKVGVAGAGTINMEGYGNDKLWKDKKVYIKLKGFTNRSYSGVVLEESVDTITIRDIMGHLVSINKSEIALLQEEERR